MSVFAGSTWPTNWQLGGDAVPIVAKLPATGSYKYGDGTVNLFSDGQAAINDFRIPTLGNRVSVTICAATAFSTLIWASTNVGRCPLTKTTASSSGGRFST